MSEEQTPEPKKPSAMMGLIKAAVIVVVLIAIEMVAAAMIIPSAEETEDLARELAKTATGEEVPTDGEEALAIDSDEATIEVELQTDSIMRFDPETDATLTIQFSIYGVVLAEEEPDFTEQYGSNTSRIHEQIMLTLHNAETADLATAGQGLIKRQILEKTNRTLGRPLLREVGFTKLNFIQR